MHVVDHHILCASGAQALDSCFTGETRWKSKVIPQQQLSRRIASLLWILIPVRPRA